MKPDGTMFCALCCALSAAAHAEPTFDIHPGAATAYSKTLNPAASYRPGDVVINFGGQSLVPYGLGAWHAGFSADAMPAAGPLPPGQSAAFRLITSGNAFVTHDAPLSQPRALSEPASWLLLLPVLVSLFRRRVP